MELIKSNLHTHTTLSDGEHSVEENVETAIERGFVSLGISDHSYVEGDGDYTIGKGNEEKYVSEVRRVIKKYEGTFDLFCGAEVDYYSEIDRSLYDYIIGSVHTVKIEGQHRGVDWGGEYTQGIIRDFCGGDHVELCKMYYENVMEHAEKNKPDIMGHFDLVTKFHSFDEDERYYDVALGALREVMKHVKRFEVNTGAVAVNIRKDPYPSKILLAEILRLGGTVVLSADCHNRKHLGFGFEEAAKMLKEIGFTSIDRLTKQGFVSDPL